MLKKNLLVSSQELIIPTGLLSCLFYSERWYKNKSHPGTLCFAGTKQEHSQEGFLLCNPALCSYPSIIKEKFPVLINLSQLIWDVQWHQTKICSCVKMRHPEKYPSLPVEELWIYMRPNQHQIQPIAVDLVIVFKAQKTTNRSEH